MLGVRVHHQHIDRCRNRGGRRFADLHRHVAIRRDRHGDVHLVERIPVLILRESVFILRDVRHDVGQQLLQFGVIQRDAIAEQLLLVQVALDTHVQHIQATVTGVAEGCHAFIRENALIRQLGDLLEHLQQRIRKSHAVLLQHIHCRIRQIGFNRLIPADNFAVIGRETLLQAGIEAADLLGEDCTAAQVGEVALGFQQLQTHRIKRRDAEDIHIAVFRVEDIGGRQIIDAAEGNAVLQHVVSRVVRFRLAQDKRHGCLGDNTAAHQQRTVGEQYVIIRHQQDAVHCRQRGRDARHGFQRFAAVQPAHIVVIHQGVIVPVHIAQIVRRPKRHGVRRVRFFADFARRGVKGVQRQHLLVIVSFGIAERIAAEEQLHLAPLFIAETADLPHFARFQILVNQLLRLALHTQSKVDCLVGHQQIADTRVFVIQRFAHIPARRQFPRVVRIQCVRHEQFVPVGIVPDAG